MKIIHPNPAQRKEPQNVGCNCKMTETYTYENPKDNLFWLIAAISIMLFASYLTLLALKNDNKSLTFILFVAVNFAFGISLLRVCVIRQQYKIINSQTTITIDKTLKEMTVQRNNNNLTIKNTDINDIEIYQSWNTYPLFYKLGYTKFNLTNGESIIVTNFITDVTKLGPVMTGKKKKYITKLMNQIR